MIAVALVLALAQSAGDCPAPDAAMLALPLAEFDQGRNGWRSLDEDGCEAAAAEAIATYRAVNASALAGEDLSGLLWHEGQLRAAAGQTEAAIPLLLARQGQNSDVDQAYVDATVAFLRQDRTALLEARERLAAMPEPETFAAAVQRFRERYPEYPPPSWPPNLDVVDGLIRCFDLPYGIAYGCREEPE